MRWRGVGSGRVGWKPRVPSPPHPSLISSPVLLPCHLLCLLSTSPYLCPGLVQVTVISPWSPSTSASILHSSHGKCDNVLNCLKHSWPLIHCPWGRNHHGFSRLLTAPASPAPLCPPFPIFQSLWSLLSPGHIIPPPGTFFPSSSPDWLLLIFQTPWPGLPIPAPSWDFLSRWVCFGFLCIFFLWKQAPVALYCSLLSRTA
jgi:hypothetical protein